MNCQIIFSIFFFGGGEGEVELSNFDFRRRTTPKKNEKQKTGLLTNPKKIEKNEKLKTKKKY